MKIDELVFGNAQMTDGVFHFDSGVFAYSDGDTAEKYIYDVVQSATDISSRSAELERKIIDWSSRYHFASSRANCFRVVNFKADARILEIGSGCGSITRYLGETGLEVIALEGSHRRAAITRSRTRDLPNVTVICGSFSELKFKTSFDYVICNGVLEYAPLFVKSPNPADAFIKQISELVAQNGTLLLAIENQLGLRYFSSGKEEHTGIMSDGIEGYARFPNGPKTYSKKRLLTLINSRFKNIELLLPLHDYKFPRAIIRETLADQVDCGELFGVMEDYAYPTMRKPNFHQRLAWRCISDAGLLSEFSNSFFVMASNESIDLLEKSWLGEIFKKDSTAGDVKSSSIVSQMIGDAQMICVVNNDASSNSGVKGSFTPWINGPSVHTLIAAAFLRNDANTSILKDIEKPILAWWTALNSSAGHVIPSENLDAIWRNAIYTDSGVVLIDQEYKSKIPVSSIFIIYRSVLNFVSSEQIFMHRWARKNRFLSEKKIINIVATIVGVEINSGDLEKAIQQEINFQREHSANHFSYASRRIRLIMPILFIRSYEDGRRWLKSLFRRIKNRLC